LKHRKITKTKTRQRERERERERVLKRQPAFSSSVANEQEINLELRERRFEVTNCGRTIKLVSV
jgi:hypothetical protein